MRTVVNQEPWIYTKLDRRFCRLQRVIFLHAFPWQKIDYNEPNKSF